MLAWKNIMLLLVFIFALRIQETENKLIASDQNLPNSCHVCKHTVAEFLGELVRSSKSKHVMKFGQVFQSGEHKIVPYQKSELRLIEAMEKTCRNLERYKVHKDKPIYFRYSKEESATFKTLLDLKDRGVDVNLGFPDEMWNAPDAEITELKRQCETILEEFDDHISEWYHHHQDQNLYSWLCEGKILKGGHQDCLLDARQMESAEAKVQKDKGLINENTGNGQENEDVFNEGDGRINRKFESERKSETEKIHSLPHVDL